MGRPTKPTHLKLIAGNPGKRKLPANEPQPRKVTSLRPPSWMKGDLARKKWRELAPDLQANGLLTELDVTALALLCQAHEHYEQSRAIVAAEGFFTEGATGTLVKHPAVRVMDGAWDHLVLLMKEFGMTPAARTRISVQPVAATESEWDELDR